MNGPWLELARALSVEQRGAVVLKEALPHGRAAFCLASALWNLLAIGSSEV